MAKKEKFYDDGRTIANMNVDGMKGYQSTKVTKNEKEIKDLNLSKKETRAITKAAIKSYLPMFLCMFGGFLLAFLLLMGWVACVRK